ncbi:MAG: hypothetical protein E6575_16335 [Bradyrhizobium sp.]|nr:hypothetical protein [Bradyrhizobium sp.]
MTAAALLLSPFGASAEEIQGNDPASPGHFQIEQRFGYVTTFNPQQQNGGQRVPQRAITGETEIGYSPTEWYEIALTSPYAFARANVPMTLGNVMDNGVPGYSFQSGGVTIRQTFIQGDRLERTVFLGLVSRTILAPQGGLTPDLWVANKAGAGQPGAPRFVKRLNDRWTVGIEHFSNLGPIGHILPWNQQMQTLYAVADTKFKGFEFSFGVGYGLTNASRGLAVKTSIGKDF